MAPSREATKSSLLKKLKRGQASLEASDPQRLIQELQMYQVELEVQNSELAETRRLLEISRDRYADLYESAPVVYCTLDSGGLIREINMTGVALFEQRREQLMGRSLVTVAHIVDKERLAALLAATCERGERATAELTMIIGERPLTVQIASAPLQESIGAIQCRATLTDITERKRSEDELRRAHGEVAAAHARAALLSDASAQLAAALPELELDGLAGLIVPRIAEWCVIELSDERLRASGDQVLAVAHADPAQRDVLKERARRHPSPEGGDAKSVATRLRVLGAGSSLVAPIVGRERALGTLTLSSSRGYEDADHEMVRELGRRIGLAIEHAQLCRELSRAARTRDQVLRLVTHDLNNSLVAIRLEASSLRARPDNAAMVKARGISLEHSVDYMTRLVADLVDLASLELGELSILPRSDDACALVREVVERLRPQSEAKALQLAVELPDLGIAVRCDHDRIVQVLWNLVGNAIKFSNAKGKISIGAARVAHEVVFTVQDSGRGIAMEDLPHVFSRRWRAQPERSAGHGLGLYIARSIVEAHRGRIWVESQVGHGSRFHFALPLGERSAPS
jgi:PAS domain S-box-containing protein